ncbi:MAG: conjugal transfer protein TrbE, partial [Selenomonadaceae bacterium]|nr:conjugal transfer protein TrbE [Selenomonadaceae bacterium]
MYKMNLFSNTYKKKHFLRDAMVWGTLHTGRLPGSNEKVAIVLNKDGSFQLTMAYHGPDLDSSIEAELSMITSQLSREFCSLPTDYVLYFEAQRIPSLGYPTEQYFPDIVTR